MKRLLALGALAVSPVFAAPALAQISGDGGPIRINADESEVLERDRRVILTNNVDITQGDARLRADEVVLNYAGTTSSDGAPMSGFGEINNMVATGNVYYVTPDLKATGDRGVYNRVSDQIVLNGNVVLVRGEDVATGERLVMHMEEGRTILDGGGGGRVQMVITPSETQTAATGGDDS